MKTIIILLIISIICKCQIQDHSITPKSLKHALSKSVEQIVLPEINIPKLLEEEQKERDLPPIFGYAHKVSYSTKNSGKFEPFVGNSRIWRVSIKTPGAFFTTINFKTLSLKPGSTLHIIPKKGNFMGAYTYEQTYKFQGKEFPVGPIKGDEFIIELYEPKEQFGTSVVEIKSITHAFKDLFSFESKNGRSGTCNINVACPLGDEVKDQVRSVGMLLNSGNARFCTGALINSLGAPEGKKKQPYFLTAAHCGSNPSGWVVMFNYEAEKCGERNAAPTAQTMNGLNSIALGRNTDFHLLNFTDDIPASYNVYLSGWSRSDVAEPKTSYAIHHPSGDNKKVSLCDTALTHSQWSLWPRNTHWRVNKWAKGTTEPGSSGSPLFDSNKRIIGQLHGGSASCRNPDGYDVYGKISKSWDYESSSKARLKEHLDPNNTGYTTCDGADYPETTNKTNLHIF